MSNLENNTTALNDILETVNNLPVAGPEKPDITGLSCAGADNNAQWNINYSDGTSEQVTGPVIPDASPKISGIFVEDIGGLGDPMYSWSLEYEDGSSHEIEGPYLPFDAMSIYGGDFLGPVYAASTEVVTQAQLRNTALVSADTDPENNGQINWTYA